MAAAGGASGAFVADLDANGDGSLYGNQADERRVPGVEREAVHDRGLPRRARAEGAISQTRAYAKGKIGGPDKSMLER